MRGYNRCKIAWLFLLFATIVTPLALGCSSKLQSVQPFAGACATDDEASAKERAAVDQTAFQFVQNAVGPDPLTAYVSFTDEAKHDIPSEKFVAVFQTAIKPMGPFQNLRVTHTYIAKVTGGTQEQRVVCGSLSRPEGWVAVNARPGPAEAHVAIEGQTVNNSVVFTVWLIPEHGNWHVQYLHYAVSEMVGKSALDFQKMAEKESEQKHDFNAFILYATALQLVDRGPYFQLGIRPEIEQGIRVLKKPEIIQAQPPFLWRFEKSTFKVLNVGSIGVGGKVYLQIDHEIEPWAEDPAADRQNRELLTMFAKSYPEYEEVFAGLVIRAHERGGRRMFGTVVENQKASK